MGDGVGGDNVNDDNILRLPPSPFFSYCFIIGDNDGILIGIVIGVGVRGVQIGGQELPLWGTVQVGYPINPFHICSCYGFVPDFFTDNVRNYRFKL